MRKIWMLPLILTVIVSTAASAAHIDLSNAKIVVLNPKNKIQANAADMLRDEIDKRTRIGLDVVSKMPGKGETSIVIGVGREVTKNM